MNALPYAWVRRFARMFTNPDAPTAPPRLLVVDDEPGIRAFVMRVLAPLDCEVVMAVNGTDAIQCFERFAPIDLLVSDLMMPAMNGLELGRRLRRSAPDLPILYLTGHSDALFEERPILAANEAYVDKPIKPAALAEAVSLALYGRVGGLRRRGDAVVPKPRAVEQHTAWM
jgi:two-component system, sensor histidine kinase and response regulator